MTPIIVQQGLAQGLVGSHLQALVDGGIDLHAGAVDPVPILLVELLAHHLGDIAGIGADLAAVQFGADRLGLRLLILFLVDITELAHTAKNVVATDQCALRIDDRVVARRRLGQTGDHRRLGNAQLVQGLAIIDLGRGHHAIGAVAEIDLVQVELENGLLVQFLLDLQRQQDLVELARVGLLRTEEEVARHLHGDGAAAAGLGTGGDQFVDRRHQGQRVHPVVGPELVILGGEKGLLDFFRNRLVLDRNSSMLTVFGQ